MDLERYCEWRKAGPEICQPKADKILKHSSEVSEVTKLCATLFNMLQSSRERHKWCGPAKHRPASVRHPHIHAQLKCLIPLSPQHPQQFGVRLTEKESCILERKFLEAPWVQNAIHTPWGSSADIGTNSGSSRCLSRMSRKRGNVILTNYRAPSDRKMVLPHCLHIRPTACISSQVYKYLIFSLSWLEVGLRIEVGQCCWGDEAKMGDKAKISSWWEAPGFHAEL